MVRFSKITHIQLITTKKHINGTCDTKLKFFFFNITTFGSYRAYVREAYKDGAAALFHLKNMGHMIPKLFEVSDFTVQVHGPAKEIEPLKEILPDADFYEAISGF